MIHQKQHLKIHENVLLVKAFQRTKIQLFKYHILRRLFPNKFMNLQLLDLKISKTLLLQQKMFLTEVFKIFLRAGLMISMKTFKDFKQCCGIVMIHSNIFQHFKRLYYDIQSILQKFTKYKWHEYY
ncbi:hypothetical protein Bpfe_022264 [Biomphalaria pfeifferi]|uniref:Uncharacterized protein n=1 Tax=Biomphalaria pfeifferi TaxID=112525 RepID=A0AAD8B699_BIOPF|nr:hypothetical protein Bpfe_022264 [Biomphalaria pfeifferi]